MHVVAVIPAVFHFFGGNSMMEDKLSFYIPKYSISSKFRYGWFERDGKVFLSFGLFKLS